MTRVDYQAVTRRYQGIFKGRRGSTKLLNDEPHIPTKEETKTAKTAHHMNRVRGLSVHWVPISDPYKLILNIATSGTTLAASDD